MAGTIAAAAYMSNAARIRPGVVAVFTRAMKKRKCLATSSAAGTEVGLSIDHIGESRAVVA